MNLLIYRRTAKQSNRRPKFFRWRCLLLLIQLANCSYHERRLYEDLMRDYNSLERPVANHSGNTYWFKDVETDLFRARGCISKSLPSTGFNCLLPLPSLSLELNASFSWTQSLVSWREGWGGGYELRRSKVSFQLIDVDEKNQMLYVNAWLDYVSSTNLACKQGIECCQIQYNFSRHVWPLKHSWLQLRYLLDYI